MEEESIKNDRVCQLINLYWDDLTSEEKKQIETANKSMKFFLKHEVWGRLEYEYETMLDILNKGYREIGD